MQTAYIVKSYSPILLAVSLGFSSPVFAEGLNLDSLSDGLTSVQEGQQTVETGKQLSTLGETAAVKPSEVGLTETLVSKLGISSAQAEGGAGVIFKAAQEQLDAAQFAQIGAAVPEMDSLLSAAPKSSTSSLISSASSMLGDSASSYGNLAALASSFSDLNLSPDMVDAFVPVVVDYVKRRGGAMTGDILQSALYGN
ncbi:MAG: DUF2780 domain-containing protein [Gammaproteobacteria bacterium]|jgi:hypothetical protein|nr:DUF2780 domain-containing protein [Gammaproteobacteria bacterium]MBT5825700.1 DUF2780 domain-containing protein [Gammaproteobacteria bacterium]MBT6421053.1 DUF2780 domain-containing protein [Gammaproteobacteria bacterium]MBT6575544.1 DUF2780 domain-containing protein [Gammaproteobacteria bacterium]MBT7435271.1 DUF2780 domain-containing protein [Gammaproteobacteria bacterium]